MSCAPNIWESTHKNCHSMHIYLQESNNLDKSTGLNFYFLFRSFSNTCNKQNSSVSSDFIVFVIVTVIETKVIIFFFLSLVLKDIPTLTVSWIVEINDDSTTFRNDGFIYIWALQVPHLPYKYFVTSHSNIMDAILQNQGFYNGKQCVAKVLEKIKNGNSTNENSFFLSQNTWGVTTCQHSTIAKTPKN